MSDKKESRKLDNNEIKQLFSEKNYIYDNLIFDIPIEVEKLWSELDECCIIKSNNIYVGLTNKFIREEHITFDELEKILIIPWYDDGNNFVELETNELEKISSIHVSGIINFKGALLLIPDFIKNICSHKDIFQIQEYYDCLLSLKERIKVRYDSTYKHLYESGNSIYEKGQWYNCYSINQWFNNINEYFDRILSLIQNFINKTKADNEEKKFNKVLKQNMWLGIISSVVAALGIIATVIVSIFKFK